jgi:pimeloyl-ACP methyl ester carboxylesterase
MSGAEGRVSDRDEPATTGYEIRLPDGRVLRAFVAVEPTATNAPVVLWHHGSPQTGAILQPILDAARSRGIRVVSHARPGYGGSPRRPGRTVADAAADVARLADTLGLDRFAVMGASGGGPHALACAALLPERVWAAVTIAGIAPYTGGDEWFAGMQAPGGLRSALDGTSARTRFAESDSFDEAQFTAADWDALAGEWAALGRDAGEADAAGHDGLVDDDVAFASPWGVDLRLVPCPVIVVQGEDDRVVPASHARWLVGRLPAAELWLRPGDGHVSVLRAVPEAMDWLLARRP